MSIRIPTGNMTPAEYERFLEDYQKGVTKGTDRALTDAATHGIAHIATTAIPKAKPFPPVLFGIYRESWKIIARSAMSIEIGSDVPYAGVIEYGSRPHWPPRAAMLLWVTRKFHVRGAEAARIAGAVSAAIAKRGTKPRYINKGSQPAFQKFLNSAVREFCT